jgi:hypothetical protein
VLRKPPPKRSLDGAPSGVRDACDGLGHPPMTGRAEWTIDRRSTALFLIASVLIVALFAFLHRGSGEARWPLVPGTIQDTRIVADHALETKWGSDVTWRADYWVAYSVSGHEYNVWADSGIRGESEAGVRLALPRQNPLCRVRYNPKKPEASIAHCR